MIRVTWNVLLPGEVEVARRSFHAFRKRGLIARDQNGTRLEAFDDKLGVIEFRTRRTWMQRLDEIGVGDEAHDESHE